jgi:diguanylate cyclase (GGDEF)-like protein/PAS domain S-box-containing protein
MNSVLSTKECFLLHNSLPKIDLLMAILKKLDAGETLTAKQLAQDFSVTERSIYRYLETLQNAGYPIYFDREYRSYRFVESYKLKRPQDSQDIVSALELRKQMLRSSSVGIAAYTTNGTCILVNSALTKMLDATKQQLLAQNFKDLVSWRDSGLIKIAEEVIKDQKERSTDIQMVSSFGKELWAHIIVTPFHSKGENFIFVMVHDISSRKQNELALSTFATSISKGPSLIMITDAHGVIEYVSDKITHITGYTADEVIGKTANIFKSGYTRESVYKNMWDTIANGLEWTGELCNRRKSGSTYWEHIKISPIFDVDNNIKRFVAVKEDVTLHKQLEDELYRHATCDALTGIYNRRMLVELANREVEIIRRHHDSMVVIVTDINQLKKINADINHEAGDEAVRAVSQACRQVVRKSDILGRTGGDECAIVLTGLPEAKALETAQRLLACIDSTPARYNSGVIPCVVSIGVAFLSSLKDQDACFETLLSAAEQAAGTAQTCQSRIALFSAAE